jgi:hypothetical protein
MSFVSPFVVMIEDYQSKPNLLGSASDIEFLRFCLGLLVMILGIFWLIEDWAYVIKVS